jgi:hypothetical protein
VAWRFGAKLIKEALPAPSPEILAAHWASVKKRACGKAYFKIMLSMFHIGSGDGIAGSMPDAQYSHMPLILPDVKNDAVDTIPFQ